MTESLFNSAPNESNEDYERRKRYHAPNSTATLHNLIRALFCRVYPINPFILLVVCDNCNGQICECCKNGIVTHYFNSEPNEPNVIGINNRMVNE